MTDRRLTDREPSQSHPRNGTVIDALVTDRDSLWALISRDDTDTLELLFGEPYGCDLPLRICREIRPDGLLVMGDADVDHDALLSRMLETEVGHRG